MSLFQYPKDYPKNRKFTIIGQKYARHIPGWNDVFFPKTAYFATTLDRVRPQVFENLVRPYEINVRIEKGNDENVEEQASTEYSTEDPFRTISTNSQKQRAIVVYTQSNLFDSLTSFKDKLNKQMFEEPESMCGTIISDPFVEIQPKPTRIKFATSMSRLEYEEEETCVSLQQSISSEGRSPSPTRSCLKVNSNENYEQESDTVRTCDEVDVEEFMEYSNMYEQKRVEMQEYLSHYRYDQVARYYDDIY